MTYILEKETNTHWFVNTKFTHELWDHEELLAHPDYVATQWQVKTQNGPESVISVGYQNDNTLKLTVCRLFKAACLFEKIKTYKLTTPFPVC